VERGEMRLHFQPKVALADGRVAGAEALLRWQHPRLGLLAPERFVALAEETGAIVPIGRWVIESACAAAAAWSKAHAPRYRVAVNLSARQFGEPQLLDDIAAALVRSGLDPALLELEITESMVMQEPEQAATLLATLRERGVRIVMDDFGTGYSSLGYLKRFPFNAVKIDRSFVRDLPHHEDDAAITRAVLAMARSLRLDVVAEGVESAEQLDFLRREGCHEYQGYHFSEPLAEDAFRRLLASLDAWPCAARERG
jgi:EAL domain-containing protein (putative c-di-GMP-specific phosphodiesterase class I)